jgi:hypothetical protein
MELLKKEQCEPGSFWREVWPVAHAGERFDVFDTSSTGTGCPNPFAVRARHAAFNFPELKAAIEFGTQNG